MRSFVGSLLRALFALAWLALTALLAPAQDASQGVKVSLSPAGEKSVFRAGEPIRLILSFTAEGAGFQLDTTTTKPASPIDEVLLQPDAGAHPWLDEYSGSHRYSPDYASITPLSLTPTRVELTLNDLFRFDRPGRYTVRVKTYRVRLPSRPNDFGPQLTLTTND